MSSKNSLAKPVDLKPRGDDGSEPAVSVPAETFRAPRTGFRQKVRRECTSLTKSLSGAASAWQNLQKMRHVALEERCRALEERCRALVRKPRIHAALEDNALDLLYPSAKEELRDVMAEPEAAPGATSRTLHAEFYRFLDAHGGVIRPANTDDVGVLEPAEESQLALHKLSREQQLGCLVRSQASNSVALVELIAVPIVSTETDEVIAALVLGFKRVEQVLSPGQEWRRGLWVNHQLYLPSLGPVCPAGITEEVAQGVESGERGERIVNLEPDRRLHRLFFERLNPGSLYPPAYEVSLFPLTELVARQRQLRWQILGAGELMLLVGFVSSHFASGRLSVPVEKLAVDSALDRAHRERAETALEQTHVELQRSIRFSADASHQLKTPGLGGAGRVGGTACAREPEHGNAGGNISAGPSDLPADRSD